MQVPTIDGAKLTIKIPPGTQHGKVFRVPEKGMPHTGLKQRGDLLVKSEIEIPTDLTPRQIELLEELGKTFGHESPVKDKEKQDEKGFFKKILG